MRIHYCGPLRDSSGYGEAARNQISAFHLAATPQMREGLTAHAINCEYTPTTYGDAGAVAEAYLKKPYPGNADIVISHCIPPMYKDYVDPRAYNIGFTVWETDGIVPEWVDQMNRMDEIWTVTPESVKAYRKSGVKVPITIIRHPIDLVSFTPKAPAIRIQDIEEDEFVFYNIGTWTTDRKNQDNLIRAYVQEFGSKEKVCLFLKTYHHSRQPHGRAEVLNEIKRCANASADRAKIAVCYGWKLGHGEIVGIHSRCDVYVSPHRGECPGLPILQAMSCGKPAIVTDWNGVSDMFTDEMGWRLDYKMYPVLGPSYWIYYNRSQKWADPDVRMLRAYMREAFENREEVRRRGRNARRAVVETFDWASIGESMVERFKEIMK